MELRLYDTLTREKRIFTPLDWEDSSILPDRRRVRMYVCGPTVYDFAHIGNARPVIVFDVLFRLLQHLAKQGVWDGGKGETTVTYVRNITDVDDKINARAADEYPSLPLNEAIRAVTEKTEKQFHEDAKALGCLDPTLEPRATEFISRNDQPTDMIRMIARLIERGNAYAAEGHVLFHVPSMPDYGKLSNRTLDDMIAGARVEVAPYKRDPMDFVLWKPSKPGEPAWPSPWSNGRPGWHMECSAMAGALLGETFDIHGGGIDLIFPHHENEIAQSRCAHGTDVMANYWLHNGFLQVEGEKMSKSLGNFVTIRDLLNDWPGEAIRFNMLKSHYRQPMDWTASGLSEATRTLDQWYEIIGDVGPGMLCADAVEALNDDLNTPQVFTVLHQLRDEAIGGPAGAKACLKATAEMLGLLGKTATEWKASSSAQASVDETRVVSFVAARATARKAKNFAEADRIRAELDAMGIALRDSKNPETGELETTWEVKR